MITEDRILEVLANDLGIDTEDIATHTLLFSSGIIDSFALVTLMIFLENEGGFRISPADVNLDNLDSIERILLYVGRVSA